MNSERIPVRAFLRAILNPKLNQKDLVSRISSLLYALSSQTVPISNLSIIKNWISEIHKKEPMILENLILTKSLISKPTQSRPSKNIISRSRPSQPVEASSVLRSPEPDSILQAPKPSHPSLTFLPKPFKIVKSPLSSPKQNYPSSPPSMAQDWETIQSSVSLQSSPERLSENHVSVMPTLSPLPAMAYETKVVHSPLPYPFFNARREKMEPLDAIVVPTQRPYFYHPSDHLLLSKDSSLLEIKRNKFPFNYISINPVSINGVSIEDMMKKIYLVSNPCNRPVFLKTLMASEQQEGEHQAVHKKIRQTYELLTSRRIFNFLQPIEQVEIFIRLAADIFKKDQCEEKEIKVPEVIKQKKKRNQKGKQKKY